MEQGIFYIVIGLASVCFFLLGKYVFLKLLTLSIVRLLCWSLILC